MKLLRYVPLPALVLGAGLALLWFLSRLDGQQTERLKELDKQSEILTQQTLRAAKSYRATAKASEAAQTEIARLRAAQAQQALRNRVLRARSDSLTVALVPVLAGLPDSVAEPVRLALIAKDSVIAGQAAEIATLSTIVDSLGKDRDRWAGEAAVQHNLAVGWQEQAQAYRKEARRGCLPVLGCVGRSTVALVAGGLGFASGLLVH